MATLAILVALAILGGTIFGVFWVAQRHQERSLRGLPPGVRPLPQAQQDMWRTGNKMARLLDQAVNDPLLRTTHRWEQKAAKLVDEWWKHD